MKPKPFNYILFVFAQSKRQEQFVIEIAEEVAVLTKSNDIRFFYGDTSCVYTFSTDEDLKSVSEFVSIILSEGKISYFLIPYQMGNIDFGIDEEVSNHLFGNKPKRSDDVVDDISSKIKSAFESLDDSFDKLKNDFGPLFSDDLDDLIGGFDDDDDDEFSKLIKKTKTTKTDDFVTEETFNSILDKINIYGKEGLTEKELSLLDKYSKQLN
jgi:hypothetical protein